MFVVYAGVHTTVLSKMNVCSYRVAFGVSATSFSFVAPTGYSPDEENKEWEYEQLFWTKWSVP